MRTLQASVKPRQGEKARILTFNPLGAGFDAWLVALALICVFAATTDGFFTTFNGMNILGEAVLIGFLAIGLTPVVISGNIDLSVGSTVGLSACLAVGLQPYGLEIALAGALGAGVAIGLLNGLFVERVGASSFIVTLASMTAVRGITFLYTGDQSVTASDPSFLALGQAYLLGVPLDAVAMIVIAVLVGLILKYSIHGRNTYAIGGNRRAAGDAGLSVSFHVIVNFVLCGVVAAVCGIAMSAKLGAALPSYGRDYELFAITAVVLGGTKLRGGVGTITGTFGAVLALTILRNGLNLVQVPSFYIPIVMGVALIAALLVDRRRGSIGSE
jgi:ribose transport system permease protein